jgi:hypothetical protein
VAHDDRLAPRDSKAAAALTKLLVAGHSYDDARERVLPLLRKHRHEMNREGTYWTFAEDPAAGAQVVIEDFESNALDALMMCTDGFTRLVHPFDIASGPVELLQMARNMGLTALVRMLRAEEEATGSMERYPRLSLSDDATAILITSLF